MHRITPPGSHIQTARWSPDGKWIVFGSTGSEPWQTIEMVRPDGTGQKKLFEAPGGGSAITPTWSPDGHKIMFALIGNSEYSKPEDQMNNKVYVINEDGEGLAVVLDTRTMLPQVFPYGEFPGLVDDAAVAVGHRGR